MIKGKKNLLIVAHPDDETLFFSGLIQQNPKDFHIICVTDANADGRGKEREKEYSMALKAMEVDSFEMLDFPDIYEKRLDQAKLQTKLGQYLHENLQEVITHNILGEYGHPHHQDVSYAVHKVFCGKAKVWSSAYNLMPDFSITLDKNEFARKAKILTEIYGKETRRFLNMIPVTSSEGLVEMGQAEVESIYQFFTYKSEELKLSKCSHLETFMKEVLRGMHRPF